jgi:ABC-type transport system substrate-binding protein
VQQFYDGIPPVATQLIPRGIFGHEPERKNSLAYDVEKAKRLLSEAGYPGGRGKDGEPLEISFLIQESPWIEKEKEFITRAMEAIGLRVRIETGNFVEMLKRRDRGAFQISTGTGWAADYPDPENFFGIFHSRRIPPNGQNAARYRSPEFDQLFDKMAWMENSPERLAIIRKLNDLLAEDCPVAFTMHKQAQTVAQPWFRRTNEADPFNAGFKFLAPPGSAR